MYNDLISLELNKVVDKVKTKFNIEIKFDKSVNELIYKEGVFPTQGVRPIFSTITSLIESYVGRIIVDIMKINFDAKIIRWKYSNEKYSITLKSDKLKKVLKYPIKLKIESIRKSKSDDIQSLVAIHESGHIITSVFSLNILPKVAASRTADDKGGYTHVDVPNWETKDFLTKNIITLIGGYCAEKLVFGEENLTTGSYSDLERTTKTALKMIKDYGMDGIPLLYSTPDFRISDNAVCLNDDELDKKAVELVKNCMLETETILNNNMELLLRLGQYLTNHSKIESQEIKEFVEKYGKDIPNYKTKDNYYEYKSILENKLKLYEK
jgi:cell division protease FtsH